MCIRDRAQAQQTRSNDHNQPNEEQPGENNTALDAENPSSVWSPETDNGTVEPFKYSFGLAHKRIEDGGWTRQVTERELPISKTMAGVEMRLITGGVRELHWHTSAEWAFMTYGNARITAVDAEGRSFVNDVTVGDLWLFPGGIPHSIQGLGPDGARFLLVFNDGSFNEFETFLLTDWFKHTPKEVLAKNFGVPASTFDLSLIHIYSPLVEVGRSKSCARGSQFRRHFPAHPDQSRRRYEPVGFFGKKTDLQP